MSAVQYDVKQPKEPGRWGPWVVALAIALWLFGGVWLIGFSGRVGLRDSQVKACIAGTVRQAQSAKSWAALAKSDRIVSQDPFQSTKTRQARAESAKAHSVTAALLLKSSRVDCHKINPKPSLLF